MTFITHTSFRGRYFDRAGSCFLEMADPGWETPPVCSEVGRAVVMSALAFFSVLWAPLSSYARPGPPETVLATLDSWLLKKGADQRAWLIRLFPEWRKEPQPTLAFIEEVFAGRNSTWEAAGSLGLGRTCWCPRFSVAVLFGIQKSGRSRGLMFASYLPADAAGSFSASWYFLEIHQPSPHSCFSLGGEEGETKSALRVRTCNQCREASSS